MIDSNREEFEKLDEINWILELCEYQQAKIGELQKLRSLDEMEINQLAQANQVWQIKCDELQARFDKALTQVNNHKHSCEARKRLKHMSASVSEIAEIEAHESNMYVLENILKGNKYD